MKYYTNIYIDYSDDEFLLELKIGFETENIGKKFISHFYRTNKYKFVNIHKKYPLVKYYGELINCQSKPNKSIGNNEFNLVISKINEIVDDINGKCVFEIYEKYDEFCSNEYILINQKNIFVPDEFEKFLINVKFIELNKENFFNIKFLFNLTGEFEKKISKDIYDRYLLNSLEYDNINEKNINFHQNILIYCSIIELSLLKIKYKFKIINYYEQLNKYDYANEKIMKWTNILYSDPLNFASNKEIIQYFPKEVLDSLKIDLNKLIEQSIIKPNITYKVYSHELSKIYIKYIYPRYLEYIEECKDL
jgi:hypothetical protein